MLPRCTAVEGIKGAGKSYRELLGVGDVSIEPRRIVVASGLSDFLDNLTCPVVQLVEERDEYDRYLARTDDPEDLASTDPITYWIGKRSVWPHL